MFSVKITVKQHATRRYIERERDREIERERKREKETGRLRGDRWKEYGGRREGELPREIYLYIYIYIYVCTGVMQYAIVRL